MLHKQIFPQGHLPQGSSYQGAKRNPATTALSSHCPPTQPPVKSKWQPLTVSCSLRRAPLSTEFSRQEYWSGLPFPSPGDHPNPGIELSSFTLWADSLLSELLANLQWAVPNKLQESVFFLVLFVALIKYSMLVFLSINFLINCQCDFPLYTLRIHTFYRDVCCYVEKAMVPHSNTLAWKIPWTEEPGRLQSMGSLRVGND